MSYLQEELKACPFCDVRDAAGFAKHEPGCYLRVKLESDNMSDQRDAWNRRASPSPSDALLACIPGNWTDPLLTGPDAVIHDSPCPEIEALLNGVRERLRAALGGKE